jgi:pimeloyl-ACP methyl ester carboxylesterase
MDITVNGIKTNYQVFGPASTRQGGEGKPFLILHGWGSGSDRWIKEAEIISEKGFKVIGLTCQEKAINQQSRGQLMTM